MADERAVLTLAAGNPAYWQMAINLARSFLWWHTQSDIRFYIVTDLPDELPKDLSGIEILRVPPDKLGRGFSAKLHLDELSPASKTLFVDADCLVVGNLEFVFARFAGRPVSVVGDSISSGDWFGDVGSICSRFGVTALPKFNGGIYYLEPGSLASQTYYRARELEQHYDELGLKRLRGRPNDELLIAISMSLQGLKAIPEDGTIMSDPQACPAELQVSVLHGRSRLVNPPPPDRRHQSWNPLHVVHPVVVHFLGDHTSCWKYRAEAKKLQLVMEHRWPVVLADGLVSGTFGAWHGLIGTIKDMLRPYYRSLFGVRPLKRSSRILS